MSSTKSLLLVATIDKSHPGPLHVCFNSVSDYGCDLEHGTKLYTAKTDALSTEDLDMLTLCIDEARHFGHEEKAEALERIKRQLEIPA